mmetsp:Transcript_23445/g.65455  ORF Transcript_23445/g.65455 Transcript_23445/m.65455 type:complete len:234 (+) Transcript_23445:672-1373(+)
MRVLDGNANLNAFVAFVALVGNWLVRWQQCAIQPRDGNGDQIQAKQPNLRLRRQVGSIFLLFDARRTTQQSSVARNTGEEFCDRRTRGSIRCPRSSLAIGSRLCAVDDPADAHVAHQTEMMRVAGLRWPFRFFRRCFARCRLRYLKCCGMLMPARKLGSVHDDGLERRCRRKAAGRSALLLIVGSAHEWDHRHHHRCDEELRTHYPHLHRQSMTTQAESRTTSPISVVHCLHC